MSETQKSSIYKTISIVSFAIWLLALMYFIGLQYSNEQMQQPTKVDNALGASFIVGLLSFGVGLSFGILTISKTNNSQQRSNSRKFGYILKFAGKVLLNCLVAGILVVLLPTIASPFFKDRSNIPSTDVLDIWYYNRWTLIIIYGVGALSFLAFTLFRKLLRIASFLLTMSWVGLSVAILLVPYKTSDDINTTNNVIQTGDSYLVATRNNCSKDLSINNAKRCTVLVIRDDGGHGTGFSIQKGFLVTNKHVIEGAKSLTTWVDGEKELNLWNYSPTMDIAIFKLPIDIPACDWFDSSQLKTAEELYAIGWPNEPYGDSTITRGIFSRLNIYKGGLEFIQTDAAINPGNSGGPLVNECGIVGINTNKESWSNEQLPRPLEGLGNALSSKSLAQLVNQLINEGTNNVSIPKSRVYYRQNNPSAPQDTVILDIGVVKNYLNNLRTAKQSWEAVYNKYPKEDMDRLFDSFNHQIAFCESLLQRLQPGKPASPDDIFMWDSIVKMSYESAAMAQKLNAMKL